MILTPFESSKSDELTPCAPCYRIASVRRISSELSISLASISINRSTLTPAGKTCILLMEFLRDEPSCLANFQSLAVSPHASGVVLNAPKCRAKAFPILVNICNVGILFRSKVRNKSKNIRAAHHSIRTIFNPTHILEHIDELPSLRALFVGLLI
jgi:hypothetical protein